MATDDGHTVAPDFRTARQCAVILVVDGRVAQKELRPKPFTQPPALQTGPRDPNDHFAGHKVGAGPRSRYDEMAAAIGDCDAVLAAEIAIAARNALDGYGIRPVTTTASSVDQAVIDYLHRPQAADG